MFLTAHVNKNIDKKIFRNELLNNLSFESKKPNVLLPKKKVRTQDNTYERPKLLWTTGCHKT